MAEGVVPVVDETLIAKYDRSGPRYTSYPTAPQFSPDFGAEEYAKTLETSSAPLSLYFHLPFCRSVCYFCGCNVTYTGDRSRPHGYTELLLAEMDLVRAHLTSRSPVQQLHWGGGTPTFFSPEEMERLFAGIAARFDLTEDAEIGIEIDPRETQTAHLRVLAKMGFNRLSLGVQDFDPAVQKAVHRIQPEDLTQGTVLEARSCGFSSLSVDLIYGLPLQTRASFESTARKVAEMAPDRIALFNFAYLPEMIRHQKAIRADQLPSPVEKLAILRMAIEIFTDAGYRYVGMDHFARPSDPLCRAQDAGTLYRNFQGYTTHAGCDLLGFGVSSIGQVGPTYEQNEKAIATYESCIREGRLATQRGIRLSLDDLVRRDAIMRLLCHFSLDGESLAHLHGIGMDHPVFAAWEKLAPFEEDGLIERKGWALQITPRGRLLVRNICMIFDAYLSSDKTQFSRTV